RAVTLTLAYGSAALGVVCLSMLAVTGRGFWLVVDVVLYGLAQGSTGIVSSARAADVFAGASFGTIFGWITLAIGPSQALGAWIGGRIFDVTASYLPAFGFAIAALVAGVLAMWQVRVAGTSRGSTAGLPAYTGSGVPRGGAGSARR